MNTTNELLNKCLKQSGIKVIVLLLSTFIFLICTIYTGQITLNQYREQTTLISNINSVKLGNQKHLAALKELTIEHYNAYLKMWIINAAHFGLLCFLTGVIFCYYYSQRKRLLKLSKLLEKPKEKEVNKL